MVELSNAIHALAGRWPAVDVVDRVAAQDLIYLGPVVLAWLYFHERSLRPFLVAALAAAGAVAGAAVLGLVDYVPRPFVAEHFVPLFPHAVDSSFPSDHVAAMSAVMASSWFWSRRLSGFLLLVTLVIGVARVFAGVHWVVDIIGGFAVGAVAGSAAWYVSGHAGRYVSAADRFLRPWKARPAN